MSNVMSNPTGSQELSRGEFVKEAYKYLIGAILAFAAVSAVLGVTGVGDAMLRMIGANRFAWFAVLGAFMLVGWLASNLADNSPSNNTQLMGLGLYVLAEALLFSPLFALAGNIPGAISAAVLVTALLTGGLTWTAMTVKTDFSFLGGMLKIGGLVALGAIALSLIMGFSLGIWFSAAMIVFAGAAILYDTSNIIRHYPTDRPAGAALHLFASVMLMLWYVLRLIMSLASSDD